MATEKKYVSLSKLTKYDELLKAKMAADDAATLASAKEYADSLTTNYESAGSVTSAKTELQGKIDAVEAKADAASSANTATQSDLDKLEALVGTLPITATATDVVGYVDEKTAGIATSENLAALTTRVTLAEKDIDAIEADYLKAADKTELSDAISNEAITARAAERANANAIKAISDDYLKASDKTALETSIAAAKKAGNDAQADINAFLYAAEVGDAAVDTLKEIQKYISTHGEAAATMTSNIAANASAISDLDDKVGDIPEGTVATDVVGYIQEVVDAEQTRATGVESGLNTRLAAVESAVGSSGSVATDIATAKQEAIDAAAADATTKAGTAESNAKTYADGLNTAMDTRVDALEADTHTHDNKTVLDGITDTKVSNWDDAYSKAHTHDNKTALDGITAVKVSAWDAAEQNAKTYADDLNTAMTARMDAVENWQTTMIEVSEAEINALFASSSSSNPRLEPT